MLIQTISIFGAICLLIGYYLSGPQNNRSKQLKAIALNILGSAILTITATYENQYGFIILEGIWCIISIRNLMKHLKFVD